MEQVTRESTNKPKRKLCSQCSQYSRGLGRCLKGKVNPRTRKDTISVASLMGVTYICSYNPWIASHIDTLLAKQRERLDS